MEVQFVPQIRSSYCQGVGTARSICSADLSCLEGVCKVKRSER